jgi:sulfatase maturation enzyme AslB (radical SAM superfamily)
MIKKFNPLNVSSKFAICGLPIRVDTYKTCSFNCKYCFSNHRKIMEFEKKQSGGKRMKKSMLVSGRVE